MTTEMKLYQSEDLQVKLDVLVENETVWLSQKQMAILYGTAVPAISKHIKNIFESGELQANSTVSKMEIVQQEGDRTVCVSHLTNVFRMDIERHNMQYPLVRLQVLSSVHDRFILLDDNRLYTFGASFKDLGKKLFCFTLIESADVVEVVRRLAAGSGR